MQSGVGELAQIFDQYITILEILFQNSDKLHVVDL